MRIDAAGLSFRDLNARIRKAVARGERKIEIVNTNGQRYIGDGLRGLIEIEVYGVAGNDLGAFMDGPSIRVYGDVGDGAGNTMNEGRIAVHGSAGDIVGYSMRGGKLLVKGNAGYRVGIHMKEYGDKVPLIIVGGLVRDFLGEYMAGGRIVVLGLDATEEIVGTYIGTGMHGGRIYVRANVAKHKLGVGAEISPLDRADRKFLQEAISEYCREFGGDPSEILNSEFTKICPVSYRPYAKTYALLTSG